MGVLKLSGMLSVITGLMLTYDAYVSLARMSLLAITENILEPNRSNVFIVIGAFHDQTI